MNQPNGLQLSIAPEALKPLIAEIVAEAIARLNQAQARLPVDRIAYSEAEAASTMSLNQHQLRDERLRGRISASRGPGKKILYTRDDLLSYLASRPWTGA